MASTDQQRVAVFFDVDNLWLSARDAGVPFDVARVVQAARQEGIIMVAKAYGDWANSRHLLPEFSRHAIEMTELATGYGGKNTADIQIATDAMEIALSARPPDTIVLVSGDRDFVPLVQKVRRYGIRVVAIGVEGTVSGVLQRACDAFLSYVDFFAPSTVASSVESTPTSQAAAAEPLSPEQVFPLLLRAVRVAEQNASAATDTLTLQLMSELDPTFDIDAYGLALREIARAAEGAGMLAVSELPDGGFTLAARGESPSPAADGGVGEPALPTVFDSPGEAANRYRAILMAKRVPLLPFETRRQLVNHLWQAFEYYRPRGMSFAMMNETLTQFARNSGLNVPLEAIRKLTFTLNIGRSLAPENGVDGYFVRNPDMFRDYFFPAVDADRALDEMHRTYIAGVRMEYPGLDMVPEGVALLLFDSRESWATERAGSLLDDVVAGRRVAYSSSPALSLGGQVGRISIGPELLRALQSSVAAIHEEGKRATGSAVREHLARTYPPFLLVESSTPFKTIASLAAEKGYVGMIDTPGMDFVLQPA